MPEIEEYQRSEIETHLSEGLESPSYEIESDVVNQMEDENETEIGLGFREAWGTLQRYVRTAMASPVQARAHGFIPRHSTFALVRAARRGDEDARDKIKAVMKLAESKYPDADLAKQAQENLAKAAALDDAGYQEDEGYESDEEIGLALDDEITDLEMAGVKVGLGLLPWIGGAVAAVLAYLLIKPSLARAAEGEGKAKIPLSEKDAKAGFSPSSWVGKKLKDLPDEVRARFLRDFQYMFHRTNPATGQVWPSWEAMDAAKMVVIAPDNARDPAGVLYIPRDKSARFRDVANWTTAWDPKNYGEHAMVMVPVVVRPAGGLASIVPSWAKSIISTAANVVAPGTGTVTAEILR